MTLVSTVEVGSGGAASIDFTSIPQTGTDLYLVVSARSSGAYTSDFLYVQINTNTDLYNNRILKGSGSAASSSNRSGSGIAGFEVNYSGTVTTANTFSNGSYYFPNYSATTNKSVSIDHVWENNATAAEQYLVAGLLATSSAITSLKIFGLSANLGQYSTASLYLITKGSGGATTSP
jgi:hypothetical protein